MIKIIGKINLTNFKKCRYLEYIGEKVSNEKNIITYKSKEIIFNENPFELLNFLGYKNDRGRM